MCDFETIFKRLLISLEKAGKIDDISSGFHDLPLGKKVSFVYDILISENLLTGLERASKCAVKAKEHKNYGNKMFSLKRDKEALIEYTKCIALAPEGSEELTLGYANRSAVLYSLRKYKLCLRDIDRIYDVYPVSLKYKLQERKGKCWMKLGSSEKAKANFMEALVALSENDALNSCHKRIEDHLKELNREYKDSSMNDSDFENENNLLIPQLPIKNLRVPSASECLRVKYSKEMGRYIVADCDVKPGEILIVENPYASILMPEFYATHCYHCFTRCLSLVPCEHCASAMFCSVECYHESWQRNHRIECSLLTALSNLKFGKMEILAVRILMIASRSGRSLNNLLQYVSTVSYADDQINGFNEDGRYISSEYCTAHHLVENIDKRSVADLFKRSAIAAFLLYCLKHTDYFIDHAAVDDMRNVLSNNNNHNDSDFGGEIENNVIEQDADNKTDLPPNHNKRSVIELTSLTEIESFVGSLLLRYLCIIPCNAHEISEIVGRTDELDIITYGNLEIGACLCPMLSLVNHSCNPNVVRHSYKDAVVLHCIEPIKAGEQVYDNYGYHYALHPLRDRQVHLCLQYYFKCKCEACQMDWPLYEDLPSEDPTYLTNDDRVKLQLRESSELFDRTIQKVIQSRVEEPSLLYTLYEHLTLLYENVKRPWKEYNDCQEAIKQCLALKSNHYCDKDDDVVL